VCNLYSHTKGPKAIRDLANAMCVSDRIWGTRALFFLLIALMLTSKWLGYK
jgi:hypothetical protein